MKNVALYVSGIIFLIMSIAQFLRYKLGMAILVGDKHLIPVEVSLYVSIGVFILAIWMFIAALTKNKY